MANRSVRAVKPTMYNRVKNSRQALSALAQSRPKAICGTPQGPPGRAPGGPPEGAAPAEEAESFCIFR